MPNFKIVCNCIHGLLLNVFEDPAKCVHGEESIQSHIVLVKDDCIQVKWPM